MFLDENNHNKLQWILDLSYNTRRLHSYNEAVSFRFQATFIICNASSWPSHWVLKTPWSGELSDNYSTLQLSMSIATMEEVVGVSVRLNQAMRQRFLMHSCEIPEA